MSINCSQTGEADDIVELAPHLAAAHSENGAIEKDVVAAGELRMKTGSHLKQAADASLYPHPAGGWGRDSRNDFEQRGFSRAVGPDDCERLPFFDLEGNVLQGPEIAFFSRLGIVWKGPGLRFSSHPPAMNIREDLSPIDFAEPIALRDVLY